MTQQRVPARAYRPRYWGTWFLMGLLWCLGQLPYRAAMRVGTAIGGLLHGLARYRRRVARCNIDACFPELPEAERARLVRENFAYTGKAFAEIAQAWWAPRQRLEGLCDIRGVEHVEQALAQGRGVILLSAHFTCLEMMPALVGPVVPTYAIYKPQRNPVNEYCMRAGRDRNLLGSLPKKDIRGILRALKANKPVWYAADQDYGRRHSVFAPFFGIPTATVTGLTRLATISKAPVVPFFMHSRDDHSGYVAEFLPPLEAFPGADELHDAIEINRVTEAAVRRHPEQYLWTHRRFKTRPDPSEPKFYRSC